MLVSSPLNGSLIFEALSPFRLGDALRLTRPGRDREHFIDDGWMRAAVAAGLEEPQRFAASCLFVAKFDQGRPSVGFYLRHDPDAGSLYLARSDARTDTAMRLFRLNPELFSDFPSAEPFVLSVIVYVGVDTPRSRLFEKAGGLWFPRP